MQKIITIGLTFVLIALLLLVPHGNVAPPYAPSTQSAAALDAPSANIPVEAVKDLSEIYHLITKYRATHDGAYPASGSELLKFAMDLPEYGSFEKAYPVFNNPDSLTSQVPGLGQDGKRAITYFFVRQRPDGQTLDRPKLPGTRDVITSTNIYLKFGTTSYNPTGFYIALWDTGQVEKISYDQILFKPDRGGFSYDFYGQAGLKDDTITYEEFWSQPERTSFALIGKPVPKGREVAVADNGGPEALVTFSRRLSYPNQCGIDREELWKQFDAAQEQFSLDEVLAGAAKLNLPLQKRALSLDELQKLGAPAIFEDTERARLATLAALDADMAIIQDEGRTRIVARETLAKRYGGNVLVKDSAPTSLQIDDAIRAITFKSKDETKEQIVTLTNSGQAPLHLQIERPIPGVSEATLDKDEIAPGQSAQLKLQIRWREVLKSDTQNVFVTIKSDDAARPRAMLGFKLSLAKTP